MSKYLKHEHGKGSLGKSPEPVGVAQQSLTPQNKREKAFRGEADFQHLRVTGEVCNA